MPLFLRDVVRKHPLRLKRSLTLFWALVVGCWCGCYLSLLLLCGWGVAGGECRWVAVEVRRKRKTRPAHPLSPASSGSSYAYVVCRCMLRIYGREARCTRFDPSAPPPSTMPPPPPLSRRCRCKICYSGMGVLPTEMQI